MQLEHADAVIAKGWFRDQRMSVSPIWIGYANTGIDEPHVHPQITEIYLVARGTAVMRIERETIALTVGDMLVVEPGEAHTFLASSQDYFHFVLHTSESVIDTALPAKSAVSRERLGL
jgi:mannose-6-phosphate isomerase-like protein (cupin superfamily)